MSYSPADENRPKHRSSKDTRRWCRGIKGRYHDLVLVYHDNPYLPYYARVECSLCGKVFDSSGIGKYIVKSVKDSGICVIEGIVTTNKSDYAIMEQLVKFCNSNMDFSKFTRKRG